MKYTVSQNSNALTLTNAYHTFSGASYKPGNHKAINRNKSRLSKYQTSANKPK